MTVAATPPDRVRRRLLVLALGLAGVRMARGAGWLTGGWMKSQLTPEEHRLLSDIAAFNRQAAQGFTLSGRTVEAMDWSGIQLNQATLENLELKGVSLKEARLTDTVWRGVRGVDLDFSGATLRKVVFEDCDLEFVKLDRARLIDCTFNNCRTGELTGPHSHFQQCRFQGWRDQRSRLEDAAFVETRIEGAALEITGFSRCRFARVTFADSRLDHVIFGQPQGDDLTLRGGSAVNCGFNEGRCHNLAFEAITLRALALSGMTLTDLKLMNCPAIEQMSCLRSQIEGVRVEGCDNFQEWAAFESTLARLQLSRSRFIYLDWEDCRVEGPSLATDCVFQGLNLTGSTWTDTTFRNCTFEEFLVLTDARFTGLKLQAPRLAGNLEIDDQGVQYQQSNRFGR